MLDLVMAWKDGAQTVGVLYVCPAHRLRKNQHSHTPHSLRGAPTLSHAFSMHPSIACVPRNSCKTQHAGRHGVSNKGRYNPAAN